MELYIIIEDISINFTKTTVLVLTDRKEEKAKIKKGVWQGHTLWPMLFSLYCEDVVKELKTEVKHWVRIRGETITAFRFADYITFCAKTEDDL